MSARYERVNVHDEDDPESPTTTSQPRSIPRQPIPSSPPPSFHSRASSPTARHGRPVDTALEDAFDSDDSGSEDDDVRRRLVRRSTAEQVEPSPAEGHGSDPRAAATQRQASEVPGGGAAASGNRVYGSGIQSDGVFSNLSARPEMGGDSEKEEHPPTYEQAAADAAPPYWETTILAPHFGATDEVYLDGMPVGTFFSFLWNAMVSMALGLVGFLLTYILHLSHAAKNGSRAGLGVTLIHYGFYFKAAATDGQPASPDGYTAPADPNSHDYDPTRVQASGGGGDGGGGGNVAGISLSEWMGYLLMIVGWFILIRSVSDYLRARRHEQLVLQSPERNLGVTPVVAEGEEPARVV